MCVCVCVCVPEVGSMVELVDELTVVGPAVGRERVCVCVCVCVPEVGSMVELVELTVVGPAVGREVTGTGGDGDTKGRGGDQTG